jgi:hypothetical protein
MAELYELIVKHHESANVVAAVASALAAGLAFLISCVSLWVSMSTLRHQRRHDALSLRPLPEVTVADYETKLRVTLRNNGVGPMIVARLVAGDGSEVRDQILAWMPDLPDELSWSNFSGSVDGRSISPGNSIVLLEITGDDQDPDFAEVRDSVRASLRGLTVNVEYTDVYNNVLPPCRKSLEWFGRHLA